MNDQWQDNEIKVLGEGEDCIYCKVVPISFI